MLEMYCLESFNILDELNNLLLCAKAFLTFIAIGVVILLLIYFIPRLFKKRVPKFVFRKLLHIVAFTSICYMIIKANGSFIAASICSLLFALIIYPIIKILEKYEWFNKILLPKYKGETANSLLQLFIPTSVIIFFLWGIVGKCYLAITAILMWGVGDAFAALIGIPFGKHKIKFKLTDGKKSYEGTIASLISSFIVGAISLIIFSSYPIYLSIIIALIVAPIVSFVELISKDGYDTITVPASASFALAIISILL